MSKLSIITILIGFLSSTVLLKAENVYDLFATGKKEEAINVLKNIIKADSNLVESLIESIPLLSAVIPMLDSDL